MSKPSRRASRIAERAANRQAATPSAAGATGRTPPARAGRRERSRPYARKSFFQRYRQSIVTIAGLAAVALVAAFVFLGATAKTYACSQIWNPVPSASAGSSPASAAASSAAPSASAAAPSSSPSPSSSPLGYVQPDMGRSHIVTQPQRYTLCPPASGSHLSNQQGVTGPIPARLYTPDDFTQPQGWIHNMEHGGLVLLYRCPGDACEDTGQSALRQFYQSFPNSPMCNLPKGQIGPVIARFDDMAWPYAAMVWGRVLPLQTLDTAQILEFYRQFGDRTNPEPQCAQPSPSTAPGASASPAPSGSVTPSGSAAPASGSPGPSAASPAAS